MANTLDNERSSASAPPTPYAKVTCSHCMPHSITKDTSHHHKGHLASSKLTSPQGTLHTSHSYITIIPQDRLTTLHSPPDAPPYHTHLYSRHLPDVHCSSSHSLLLMDGQRHGQLVPSLLHLPLQVLLSLPLLPLLPFHVLLLKEQLLSCSVRHVDYPVLTLKLKGWGRGQST